MKTVVGSAMSVALLVFWKAFAIALTTCLILTPVVRWIALRFDILDRPISPIKTHKQPVPYLGGVAVFLSFALSMILIRFNTTFPSGTLTALRGLLTGGAVIFILGLVDDVIDRGLHYRTKFLFQVCSACLAILFGIRIRFIHPNWMADILTIVWIVGITNAFNLIDIMDGLASGVAGVATLAFLFIALPSEEIYVNVASAALCGSVLGFFPYNITKRFRIFMGDSGSLLLGYICSLLALGNVIQQNEPMGGVCAALDFVPAHLRNVFVVSCAGAKRNFSFSRFQGPFRVAQWKRSVGSDRRFWFFLFLFSACLCLAAYGVTRVSPEGQLIIYSLVGSCLACFHRLHRQS